MLGAIGAASIAAHKFWPKGITYGDKDDWETATEKKEEEEKKKLKGKLKEGRDVLEGKDSGSNSGGGGGGGRDPERERYIQERYRQRPRLPPSMEGEDGAQFWERRERLPARRRYIAAYADPRDDGREYLPPPPPPAPSRQRIEPPPPPPPPTNYADPGTSERDGPASASRRRIAAAAIAASAAADKGPPAEEKESQYAEPPRSRIDGPAPPPPPPPPAAPAPPRTFIETAPLVVPAGASRRSSSGRSASGSRAPRYYVDGDTIVVPSSGERTYVIQRDAPPGQRLRQREIERVDDRGYYR